MSDTIPEFDHPTRGPSYSHANTEMPTVRSSEVNKTLEYLKPKHGEVILEFGPGNGILTQRLVTAVGAEGAIIGVDNSSRLLSRLQESSPVIQGRVYSGDGRLPVDASTCDAVVSLANAHHIANKHVLIAEFARALKPSGRLIVADVLHGTNVQRYFDEVVDRICSTGHKHKFFTKELIKECCFLSCLKIAKWNLEKTPWQFDRSLSQEFNSPYEVAGWFLKKIHDAQCTAEECVDSASTYLGFDNIDQFKLNLNWELFFLHAIKKRDCAQSQLTIRMIDDSDYGAAMELIRRSSETLNKYDPKVRESILSLYKHDDFFRLKEQGSVTVVAEACKRVVGIGSLLGDRVVGMYVEPQFFRRGIGTAILSYIEALALERNLSHLTLRSSEEAKLFYIKHGYCFIAEGIREIGKLKIKYLQMEKALERLDNGGR